MDRRPYLGHFNGSNLVFKEGSSKEDVRMCLQLRVNSSTLHDDDSGV